jgi:hypothetical protein
MQTPILVLELIMLNITTLTPYMARTPTFRNPDLLILPYTSRTLVTLIPSTQDPTTLLDLDSSSMETISDSNWMC